MGSKNKTVSFRLREDKFDKLKEISDDRNFPLSALFRDYVDMFISHNGKVKVVPEHECLGGESAGDFPVKVEVPKSFVREHERVSLENEHLRENLKEYRQYATRLKEQLEEREADAEDVVHLEDLDEALGRDAPEL